MYIITSALILLFIISGCEMTDLKSYIENIVETQNFESPIADFTADKTVGEAPLTVNFTDQSIGDIYLWEWDINSDGIFDSYMQNPNYVYTYPGNYTVTLKVIGPAGTDNETKIKYINVGGVPVANFSASITTNNKSLTVNFTDLSEGDIWMWEWDFDNNGIVDSYNQNPQYTYNYSDTYTVKLIVTGLTGSDEEIKYIYIKVYD